MPMAVERLTPQSSPDEVTRAISASIKELLDSGAAKDEAQASAIAYSAARKSTGMALGNQRKSRDLASDEMSARSRV